MKFGYVLEKATGNIIGYWNMKNKPENDVAHEYVECAEKEKPALYEEPQVPEFSEKECKADLFDSLGADFMSEPYVAVILDLIRFQDWERLKTMVDNLLAKNAVTKGQADAFVQIIKNNNGKVQQVFKEIEQ